VLADDEGISEILGILKFLIIFAKMQRYFLRMAISEFLKVGSNLQTVSFLGFDLGLFINNRLTKFVTKQSK